MFLKKIKWQRLFRIWKSKQLTLAKLQHTPFEHFQADYISIFTLRQKHAFLIPHSTMSKKPTQMYFKFHNIFSGQKKYWIKQPEFWIHLRKSERIDNDNNGFYWQSWMSNTLHPFYKEEKIITCWVSRYPCHSQGRRCFFPKHL